MLGGAAHARRWLVAGQRGRSARPGRGNALPLRPRLRRPRPGAVARARAPRLPGPADQRPTGPPLPRSQYGPLPRRAGHSNLARTDVPGAVAGLRAAEPAPPVGLCLQAPPPRALRGQGGGPGRLVGAVSWLSSGNSSRAGRALLRRRGPPHPQHALHPRRGCQGPRTAPAHGQRPRPREPERGAQRPLPCPGTARRNRPGRRAKYPPPLRAIASRSPRHAHDLRGL